jgi:hypothetical protein
MKKIEDDLLWIGPRGKALKYVLLSREMAEAILVALQKVRENA